MIYLKYVRNINKNINLTLGLIVLNLLIPFRIANASVVRCQNFSVVSVANQKLRFGFIPEAAVGTTVDPAANSLTEPPVKPVGESSGESQIETVFEAATESSSEPSSTKVYFDYKAFAAQMIKEGRLNSPKFDTGKGFLEFLKTKRFGLFYRFLSEKQKEAFRSEYLEREFNKLANNLVPLQAENLAQALIFHGSEAMDTGNDGYQILHQTSSANLERLLPEIKYVAQPEMKKAERLVEELTFNLVHNTHLDPDRKISSHILSSKYMAQLGLYQGINSREVFNREILRSDDQVFFFITLKPARTKYALFASEYGPSEIHVDKAYARARGWVSPFIMYPKQLTRILKYLGSDIELAFLEAFKLKKADKWESYLNKVSGIVGKDPSALEIKDILEYGDADEVVEILTENPELWKKIRQSMHKYNFSLSDFEALIRNTLLYTLDQVRTSDISRFNDYLAILETGSASEIEKLVKAQVFDYLNLPNEFEFKIPIAIPFANIKTGPTN